MRLVIVMFTVGCLTAGCAGMASQTRPQVHVQLNDGQVLVGGMTTEMFKLKTEFGMLDFSTEDAGELGPLEGKDMEQAGNLIKLWLRNGSEFIGAWERPSVEVAINIGGKDVAIDVPIEKIKRMRFRGDAEYTEKPLYRVLTRSGDDFFVDASVSKIHFKGELGVFSPFLAEIAGLERNDGDDNQWQIRLKNGTTLHAGIEQDGVELSPAMGPEKVKLSWSLVARMEPAHMNAPAAVTKSPVAPEYYDNAPQRAMKEAAAQSWSH
jgi:hypothetical protein